MTEPVTLTRWELAQVAICRRHEYSTRSIALWLAGHGNRAPHADIVAAIERTEHP